MFSFFFFLSVSFWYYGFCTFLTLTNNGVASSLVTLMWLQDQSTKPLDKHKVCLPQLISQHWLCSRMHMQNRLTSAFQERNTAIQKFCEHWLSMQATVWTRFNFHARFWVEYYTSDWTLIAWSWPKQICVSTGCCCSNCSLWVTWTLATTCFLNAYPKRNADGAKEKHTSLQLAYILLKSDKETLHF